MEFVPARSILTRTKGAGWFGLDYTVNLYRGCCHGCIYCDSRSECYGIEEFDRVRAKADSGRILQDELRRRRKTGVIGTGSMSDPYNPCEKKYRLTREALTLADRYGFGMAVATKSDLITRDMDILRSIRSHSPVLCKITVTSVDDALCEKLEPRAPPPSRRLEAVSALSGAGIFTGILLMPVLPFLEDGAGAVEALVARAAACGARFIYPAFGVTLRQNQRQWFYDRLEEAFPGGGFAARYRRTFGDAYECRSPNAARLLPVFKEACARSGILYRMPEIIRAYRAGYTVEQTSLFG